MAKLLNHVVCPRCGCPNVYEEDVIGQPGMPKDIKCIYGCNLSDVYLPHKGESKIINRYEGGYYGNKTSMG